VVPVTVINHFLDDVQRHGSYSGVCVLGAKLQGMDNAELRAYFGMAGSQPGAPSKGAQTGVLVVGLAKLAPAASLLKVGDVLLSVDGVQVGHTLLADTLAAPSPSPSSEYNECASDLLPSPPCD
jgi:S1-C subfamily serine protease